MPEYAVDICYNWDGRKKVCDFERCRAILSGNDGTCYHKPVTINGQLHTVVGALDRILGEPDELNHDSVTINGQKCTPIGAIRKIFSIEQK